MSGQAYLLKLADADDRDLFRTYWGLRRQEPFEPDIYVGHGVATGDTARLATQAIALRGAQQRVELSFEDGVRLRGDAMFREVAYRGDSNGERQYCVALHLTNVEEVR